MKIELRSLKVIHETDEYYFFKVFLYEKRLFGKHEVEFFAARKKDRLQSFFLHNGKALFRKYLYLDRSINAILDKPSKQFNFIHE